MTDYSIWNGAAPPSAGMDQSTDTQHYTLGTVFQVTTSGLSAKAIRFYFLPGAWNPLGAPTKVALYDFTTQALLASAIYSGGVPGAPGWTDVPISPVALSTSAQYVAAVLYPNGYYPFESQYFHLHTQTTGPLTAFGDDAPPPIVNNGRFAVATDLAFPTDSFGNTSYFADVVVSEAAISTTLTLSGGGAAASVSHKESRGVAAVTGAGTPTTVSIKRAMVQGLISGGGVLVTGAGSPTRTASALLSGGGVLGSTGRKSTSRVMVLSGGGTLRETGHSGAALNIAGHLVPALAGHVSLGIAGHIA